MGQGEDAVLDTENKTIFGEDALFVLGAPWEGPLVGGSGGALIEVSAVV